jgi:C-terminal processing protease CtpA/Prc
VVKITREIITIISVKGYLLKDGIGYVRVSSFQKPSTNLLHKYPIGKASLKRLPTKRNEA